MTALEKNKVLIEEMLSLYIEKVFWDNNSKQRFFNYLKSNYNCFIFGGIIVDYLLKRTNHRDVDIVIDNFDNDLIEYIERLNGSKNSFGGYKVVIDNLIIDIWPIEKTWAFKRNNTLNFFLPMLLPMTSFFNATSIIYSLSEQKLYWTEGFSKFLTEKKVDIVFEENPYPELCIVKTIDYIRNKYEISPNLKKYIRQFFGVKYQLLESIQIKHYGFIKYSLNEIITILQSLEDNNRYPKTEKEEERQFTLF